MVVRLTLDQGGREIIDPAAPPGQRMTDVPGGDEPHIIAGSRRGVPYHSLHRKLWVSAVEQVAQNRWNRTSSGPEAE